ncbi:MAG: Phosphate acyltransferase [Verrucomicrobiales bacterium]|nr:Phosphate acyltransferase [Verrucomicrobiales bacterium]
MRIVVDVMGGDHGCGVVIDGVKLALQAQPKITALYLVGNQSEIEAALTKSGLQDSRLQIVHASEVLTMEDKPAQAVRRKRDASVSRAMDLVKEGKADAVISPGNTGGIMAAAHLKLRTLPGVDRPGIATVIPTAENDFVLLDSGANIDSKPIHLAHYAVMGHVYSREMLGVKSPRVGILSVGSEETKGNELTIEAFKLCKQLNINFIGNVEGYDLFRNRVDVVVCDGFVGNIVLKTMEGMAKGIFGWLKTELNRTWKRKIGGLLAKDGFMVLKRRMDPENSGGAPLLGLNGNVFKAHGSSRAKAITSAVRISTETVQHQINEIITREVADANQRLEAAKLTSQPVAAA